MIEVRDLRGVSLREAIEVVVDARTTRQLAGVQEAVGIDPHRGHLWRSPLGLTDRVLPDGRTYRVKDDAGELRRDSW